MISKISRRSVVKGFSLLALPFGISVATPKRGQNSRNAIAPEVALLRYLNTALATTMKSKGVYAPLYELDFSWAQKAYAVSVPASAAWLPERDDFAVPGLSIRYSLANDKRSYQLSVSNGVNGGYISDQTGRIYVLKAPLAELPTDLANVASPWGGPSGGQSAIGKGLTSAAASLVSLFVPTLFAFDRCDCGDCASSCWCPYYLCCNLGYGDCPWCCNTWASCGCL